ncbi:MAG TPA: hypothetical protein VJN48_10875 [Terriglobales bacterium]|nr:hypothetical protein [Terriglobales bacterium]
MWREFCGENENSSAAKPASWREGYIEGWGGIRHCDMVTVTESGAEVLTPFQSRIEDLIVDPHKALRDAA